MRKRYDLGTMDRYPIVVNKTQIENNPFFQVEFEDKVNVERLYRAVKQALEDYPLFGCTMRYDKDYYLETNEAEFVIFNVDAKNRPLSFGDNTNGFLWQMCYDDHFVTFEWCHAVTDGRGALAFFTSVLLHYFGVETHVEPALELGLEHFYDKNEAGIPQKKQEKGHKASTIPYIKRGYKTDCHVLKAPMSQVLAAAKRNDSSPAAILPPLFSMALRKHMKETAKNKNVSCSVVIDCRGPLKFNTMHNFIVSKIITYIDRYDTMEFPLVSTIYRAILDLAVQPENMVKEATDTIDRLKPLVSVKPRFLQKVVAKVGGIAMKHSDSNFTFTYLGKIDYPDEVMKQLRSFAFRSWTDFGECNIGAVDFNGELILNLCENYQDKQIVPDFIEICDSVGLHFENVDEFVFEQANLRMKGI